MEGQLEAQPVIPKWTKLKEDDSIKRKGHTSVVIEDLIVTFGGHNGKEPLSDVLAYDIKQNVLQEVKPSGILPKGRHFHTSCYYKDLSQVVFGGYTNDELVLNETAILTIADTKASSYKWKLITTNGGQNLYRWKHTANIHENKMYVFGGQDKSSTSTNELWCLNIDTFEWEQCKPSGVIPEERVRHCSILHEDVIYYFGGYSTQRNTYLNDLFMLNLKDMSWLKVTCSGVSPCSRFGVSVQEIQGQLYFFGGKNANSQYCNDLFSYDTNCNAWQEIKTSTDDTPTARVSHTSIIYQDSLIIWGGSIGKLSSSLSPEIYSLQLNLPKEKQKAVKGKADTFSLQMRQSLFSKKYSDIIFQVQGQGIPAHKSLLAIRCDYFGKMFTSGMKESQTDVIPVPNVNVDTFKAILEFIYCNTTTLNEDLAVDVFKLCDEYLFQELKDICEEFLSSRITSQNYFAKAELAEKFELSLLKKAVMKFVLHNLRVVKERDDFSSLSRAFLVEALVNLHESTTII